MSPDAVFDCLFISSHLQSHSEEFSAPEIHLLAYLGCLISLYEGRAVSDWGYAFVATELGAPYSVTVAEALTRLETSGYLTRRGDRLVAEDSVRTDLAILSAFSVNRDRAICLDAATASTIAFSPGMVGSALSSEPELKRARDLPQSRQLLEETALSLLHQQFASLRAVLPESSDLRVPAVVWLEALYRVQQPATA